MTSKEKILIAMTVYEGFNLLDLAGPYVFFSVDPRLEPIIVSIDGNPVRSDQGLKVSPDHALEYASGSDVIWVPGGSIHQFFDQIELERPLLHWLKDQALEPREKILCSVCTGAFIAAAAGWLDGYTATTHWQFQQQLALFPGVRLAPGFPRYWLDGSRLTGGGVSSGMDEALALIAMLLGDEAAENVQLTNQYAPDPPFNSGTPVSTPPRVLADYFKANMSQGTELESQIKRFLKGR